MSIVKDVNFNGKTASDTNDLLVYLTDGFKTDSGKYVAGLGFVTENYFDEFQAVKVVNQKTGGRQFRQITIAPSPAGNNLSREDYLEMGIKIAQAYYSQGFQVVVTVHLDTDTLHLHLAVNSVNFRTGKMFSQSLSDLNRFKMHCNHVFKEYGLDPIGKPAETLMDSVVHDMSEGFNCLELLDEIMADKANTLSDLYDDPSRSSSSTKVTKSDHNNEYVPYCYFFSANNRVRTPHPYKNNNTKYPEVNKMNYKDNNQQLPTISVSQLPSVEAATPGIYINFGKEVNLALPNGWGPEQVSELVNNINPLPDYEKANNSKIAEALFADLKSRGIETKIGIGSDVRLNLTFDDVINSSIISIDSDDENK